jgi:hypothetical protein
LLIIINAGPGATIAPCSTSSGEQRSACDGPAHQAPVLVDEFICGADKAAKMRYLHGCEDWYLSRLAKITQPKDRGVALKVWGAFFNTSFHRSPHSADMNRNRDSR